MKNIGPLWEKETFRMRSFRLFRPLSVFLLVIFLSASVQAAELDLGKWNPEARGAIQKMIDTYGKDSKNYSVKKKPYAVFDWDQTCIFNDTQEAMFRYMIDRLLFKATPEQFAAAIRMDVPKDNFTADYNNAAGQPVNIDLIAADLDADYQFLYEYYIKDGGMSLAEIKMTAAYEDFRAKLAYLYEAIGGTFSAEISYPWVLYLFVGMTEAEVSKIAEESNDYALGDRLGTYNLTSPRERPGKAGIISLDGYKYGLRLAPEMSNLMNVLRESGFDVYVCSASHEAVVRVFAGREKYGYGVPPENVIAMKTKIKDGIYLGEYDYSNDYPQTQQKGKVTAIDQVLVKKYGYGPIFVAGDSQGDFNMSTEFPETKLTLIINRLRKDDFGKLGLEAVKPAGQELPRYVIQGRDENTGQFRPSASTIKMGKDQEALFNDAIAPK